MTEKPVPQNAAEEIIEIVRTVGYALAIALVLRVLLFQPFTIPSSSMEPIVKTGDYIVVSKWDYGYSRCSFPFNPPLFKGRILGTGPKRGDVVVFQLPRDISITYIKRVIGLPGDKIRVQGGNVFVNGKAIPRQPLGLTQDLDSPDVTVMQVAETKPDGSRYITYDRATDHDGDDTDTYVVPEGHYFMMGDNRDNSLDSRWPEEIGVGYVPAENIVGKARFVLISWKEGSSMFKPWTWLNLNWGRLFKGIH